MPEGWGTADLGELAEFINGIGFSENDWSDIGTPIIRIQNLTDPSKPMNRTARSVDSRYVVENGELLVSWSATLDAFMWNGDQAYLNQHIFRVIPDGRLVDKRFLYRAIQQMLRSLVQSEHLHGSGMRHVNRGPFLSQSVALPPVAEQRRIVAQVEALLARTSAARERLARVPSILKRFRRAVLAAACSGQLTADWRLLYRDSESALDLPQSSDSRNEGARARRKWLVNEEPASGEELELPPTWTRVTFDQVCDDITVGYVGPMARQYVNEGIPFLRSLNVREFRFEPKDLKFVSRDFHSQIRKSALHPGDVAVVRSGNAGVACVIPDDLTEANCSDLVVIRPSSVLNSQYATIYLNSPSMRSHVESSKVGIAQGHFNIGFMRVAALPLPPLAEQREIVRRVEALFALADAVERRVSAATQRADKLTQAILGRAFRGELVPTEAELARAEGRDYEPASVLLERIQAERANQEVRPLTARKRRTPARQPSFPGT